MVDEKYLKSEATCKDFAVYYKSCSVCGVAGTDTFNGTRKEDHTFDNDCDTTCNAGCGYTRTITHRWETTYSSDDNKHWYECEVCGEKKEEGNHTGGTATCEDKAVCDVCNKAFGELAPHQNTDKVDATYLKSEATCIAKAVYYKSCSVCGTASTDTFTNGDVDSHNHTGNTEVKDDAKATCTTEGYSGDIYCKDCGEKLEDGEVIPAGHDYGTGYKTDADNHWKKCECGDVTEKGAHLFGEWTTTKNPTTTEKGSKEKVCSVCGYKVVEELSVLADTSVQNQNTNSPKTGDGGTYWIWVTLAAFSLFMGMKVLLERKRKMRSLWG